MKLTFLGSGTAFSPLSENFNSNMVLESDSGKRLLIDCGVDVRHSSLAQNLTSHDFDGVYISHFHSDHCGGLEWLALSRKFSPKPVKPKLMIHPSMAEELWEHLLCAGLSTLENEKCDLETFFEIYQFEDDRHFQWEGIHFELIQTHHFYHLEELRPSYGLFIDDNKSKLLITSDTQFMPELFRPYFEAADCIFHDCETTPKKTGVHPHYNDLITLPKHIKQKMWLYHYSSLYVPKHHDDFLGFVQRGQVFDYS